MTTWLIALSSLSLLASAWSLTRGEKGRICMQSVESFRQFSSLPPWYVLQSLPQSVPHLITYSRTHTNVCTRLIDRCASQGYVEPTVAQKMAIPSILKGNDVILQSETGSGKTLAYSLPILAAVDASRGIVYLSFLFAYLLAYSHVQHLFKL